MHVLVTQLCPTFCNLMDCNPPGSSVHGILQARILEWVAMPSSRRSSQLRDWTQVSWIARGFFTIWTTRDAILVEEGNAGVKDGILLRNLREPWEDQPRLLEPHQPWLLLILPSQLRKSVLPGLGQTFPLHLLSITTFYSFCSNSS